MSDQLDDLLKELKDTGPVTKPPEKPKLQINEESVNQYIMDNAAKLIDMGLGSVEAMRDVILQSFEAKDVEAYALLIKSVADSMETINKINLVNKKLKVAKELKTMDIDARKQLGPNINTSNTNVLIATRDEIIKGLMQAAMTPAKIEAKVIDVVEEESETNQIKT